MNPARANRRFGDYELIQYLAAGGMADLYLARHPRWEGHDLVIKRIQRRYLDHTRVVRMFLDEGRIAQLLDHPNIVRVLDVGDFDGDYYIAMEYIPGHDLIAIARRSVLTGLRLPRPVTVGLAAQVAAGLDYAHARLDAQGRPLHIVHCDVSPGNVVVSFGGTAKIVDFGIARATIALREEDGVAGKYNYMAPEQIRGEPVDARADLFSLGVILYELTVGRRLFKGPPEQVMRRVIEGQIPRPSSVVAGFPRSLERILARLLAPAREARYPSAAALRDDLREYLRTEEVGWGKREIARYLGELYRAPRSADADDDGGPDDDDLELEHGMPEAPAARPDEDPDEEPAPPVAESDDDGPTGAIELPSTEEPLAPAGGDATEMVRLPSGRPRRRRATPGVYAGGAMLALALVLLVAYFVVQR